jgi:hypothetical protein
MSIVAYYVRLSSDQLPNAVADPGRLASGDLSHLHGAEFIDIDRAWEPIAWLLSECKRAEVAHNARAMDSALAERRQGSGLVGKMKRLFGGANASDGLAASARAIEQMKPDDVLVGVEGRGPTKEAAIDFGMGPGCVLSSEEVQRIASALRKTDETSLGAAADFAEMERVRLFPDQWNDEGEEILRDYVVPNFIKLKEFYSAAAREGQAVLMWYT